MKDFERRLFGLGYWNANGIATAIVAVANYLDGELFDWAAYIGGTTRTEHEEDTYEDIAKHGSKLDHAMARFLILRKALSLDVAKYRA